MRAEASNRRDRLREVLTDLKMPGALEAVDGILARPTVAWCPPPSLSSSCRTPRSGCATTAACRRPCTRRGCLR